MAAFGGGAAAENETMPDAAGSTACFGVSAGFAVAAAASVGAVLDVSATGTLTSTLNGSLSLRWEKAWSCPETAGAEAAAVAGVAAAAGTEPGVGAASPAGFGCSCFQNFGPCTAATIRKRTARTITIFFCFACLAWA